jgi:hypothetical protein
MMPKALSQENFKAHFEMIFLVQAVCKLILARPLSIDPLPLPVARILESTKFRAYRKIFYVVDRLRNVQNA